MFYVLKCFHFSHLSFSSVKYSTYSHSKLLNLLTSMPKEPTHIHEAQKQRKKIKERLSKYVPGRVTLQVLGTGSKGAPRALYMFSDQSRYLFNCGEGTQRLAHEHKMKLAKLEHIFITQPVWKNIGGLPGIALTIQDVGVPEITLHGPPGLNEIFYATKRFVILRDLKVYMAECGEENDFEDNVMKVKYIPLTRNATKTSDDSLPEYSEEENEFKLKDIEVEAVVEQAETSTSTRSDRSRKKKRNNSKNSRNSSRSNSADIFEDHTDYYAYERKKKRKSRSQYNNRSRSRSLSTDSESQGISNFSSKNSQQILEKSKETGVSMAYICKLQPRPGALNLEKCVQMGIKPGPLLGKLKSGEDVVLPNGNVVKSKDVCEPDNPGPIFIVVDCPTADYIDSLNNNPRIGAHQKYNVKDEAEIANLIVHFTPKDVVNDPRYKAWMNHFPSSTTHLMLNEYNKCMGSEAVHKIQYKLNLLSDNIFPLLGDKDTTILDMESEVENKCKKQKLEELQENLNSTKLIDTSCIYIYPKTFCAYHLRPKKGLDRSLELKLDPKEYVEETYNVNDFKEVLQLLQQKLYLKKSTQDNYPKILFLGTGSCIPNKTRNTSGILLLLNEHQNILMDCGEGTYGQIIRFFGPELALNILANTDAIYVSHLHADHHIGLIGVLQGRKNAIKQLNSNKQPLYLFAPKQIMTWLNFYDKCFEDIRSDFELVANGDLEISNPVYTEETKRKIINRLGLKDINTCIVKHCPNAFGVSLSCRNGMKLTYSGDTMPSENLIRLGENSDILIHEATMEDELAQEAIVKMHSTTSQAIEVGNRMNAKNIILTHFSQRYAKLPIFNDNFGSNVSIAFDNMQVSVSDLQLFTELYPALKLMFADHYEELENKAVKRQLRKEREKEQQINDTLKRKQIMT